VDSPALHAAPGPAPASARRAPSWRAWLLLAPLVGWITLFVVAPLLLLLAYSLGERDELGRVALGFNLENYQRVADPVYLTIFGRSLGYAAVTTVICLLAGFPMAYCIGRAPPAWRQRLLLLVMIPFWTSFLIRTYAWMTLLREEGLVNAVLRSLHLITAPLELLYTPLAVVIGLVYAFLPFMILPIYASVEKLNGSLIEAAHDLGAGPWRVFPSTIIPLTLPGIGAGVLLVFVPAIAMFAITDLLGGARVPLLGNVIQNQFLAARDWPFGAALGTTFVALFAICHALLLRAGRDREDLA
jgi:spermidine/putrescine transport system permease protein